jgi:subtilisin family serine protease
MAMIKTLITLSIFALALAACSGGGGGSGFAANPIINRDNVNRDNLIENTNMMHRNDVPPTKSSYANATRAFKQNLLAERFIDWDDRRERDYRQKSGNDILFDNEDVDVDVTALFRPVKDTQATDAWQLGWTGRGIKIGVLDGFIVKYIPVEERDVSHGAAVSFVAQQIAPEASIATRQLTFGCNLPAGQQERQIKDGFDFFEANGYHIVNNSWSADRYFRDSCKPKGSRNPGLLPNDTWQSLIVAEKQDAARKAMIIPLSDDDAYDANMLFVFAAGNGNNSDRPNYCPGGMSACNLLAAAIESMRQDDGISDAGARVLFVGALSDESFTSRTKDLALYSYPAGDMPNDYIVAYDDIFRAGDGSGTSFAAPRVAGAAAIVRHKFPSLNGPKLKQVLLKSADDLGAPGPDAVFGHGQLNLINALLPIDGLTR